MRGRPVTTHKSSNRLANEKSPYLLQHAHNPVDWYPWGDEAFVKAQGEKKPIFLSVGYSTCHWCQVGEFHLFNLNVFVTPLSQIPVKFQVYRINLLNSHFIC
nr:DUF255 domain-containing protein [Paenibacillus sp. FSL P4-0081]